MTTSTREFRYWSWDWNGDGEIDGDGLNAPVFGQFPLEPGETATVFFKTTKYLGSDGAGGGIFEDDSDGSLIYLSDTNQLQAGDMVPDPVDEPLSGSQDAHGEEPGSSDPTDTPVIGIGPAVVSQAEGDVGTTEYTFNVTRTGDLSKAAAVLVTFDAGDTDSNDFGGDLPDAKLVLFDADQDEQQVTYSVTGDLSIEEDETFTVSLETPVGATIDETASSAVGTIVNDDGPPIDPGDFNQIDGNNADNYLQGTNGNDLIRGFGGTDVLEGKDGNDILDGGTGTDFLYGGGDFAGGDDILYGGAGTDFLDGGGGNDILLGGADGDVVKGGGGNDVIFGGDGEDFISGGTGNDILNGGDRSDLFDFSGNFGDDIITDFDDTQDGLNFDSDDISIEEKSNGTLITVTDETTDPGANFGTVFLLGVTDLDEIA
jgi:Ca2+-binding RTX toxin-like protein